MAVTAISAAISYGVSSVVTAGVASVIGAGIIASGVGMIAGGIASSMVKSALAPNPSSSSGVSSSPAATLSQPEAARGLLLNTSGNVAPIPVIYGARRVGGPWALPPTVSGSGNMYLNMVVVLSEGEIEAIDEVYLDGVAVTDGRFSGLVTLEKYLGTDGQTACPTLMTELPALWTSAHRLAGVAYVYLRLRYDSNAFHSLPTVTADIRGRKLYDPRSGLTAYSTNPALMVRDYLSNTRYGRGVPADAIDDTLLGTAADHCDESVTIPGGTQARYVAAGVVNPDDLMVGTLSGMLTSCRGMLVYSGGKFKLVQDRATTSSFDFDADNIIGEWSIKPPGKREKMNRIRARFFNPEKDWQADLAIQESAAWRSDDNGLVLEHDVDLPFTADLYRAQQIAQIEMKQSRIGIVCQFTATVAATEVEVGDVVTITHATPGWSGKLFRVTDIELRQDDEVALTCREYDVGVYTLDNLVEWTPAVATNLPDPLSVPSPGTPEVVETLYETTGSAGVKAKAVMSWAAVENTFVVDYLPEHRASGGIWISRPATVNLYDEIVDLAPGYYDFRLRARNIAGILSDTSAVRTVELRGLTAPPGAPTGFYVVPGAGVAHAQWTLTSDLDVQIGGRAVVRHAAAMGASWNDGVVLQEFPGSAVSGTLPLLSGTYLLKFQDSTGNFSETAASFYASEDSVTGWSTVATVNEHPAFTGTKTTVANVGGAIQLDAASLVDDLDLVDDWGGIDTIGGSAAMGSYDFAATLDLGTVATRNFIGAITALSFDTADFIDGRNADIDYWDDIEGGTMNDCDVTLYLRTTPDNPAASPTWGAWTPFFVGDFNCRAAQFRLDFASGSRTHNIAVSALQVRARIPL